MPEESDEKTPWWVWPLIPIWLLIQGVSFLFVIAFTVWRLLLALTIPVVVIAVVVVLITGGGDDSPTNAATSLGPDQQYNEEAVAVLNKYSLYVRTLPKATQQNLDTVLPRQIQAEKTAVRDFGRLLPPSDLQQTHVKLRNEMTHEVALSEEAVAALENRETHRFNVLVSEISDGLVEFNRLGTEIYEAAEAE